MTYLGTRPPTVDEWEKYELHHRSRMSTKPGITGMWQVSGRSDITDFEEVVRLDTEYIEHWTIAYLYRIKVGNKYLLVKNERGTEKYQPVGGVYKLAGNEKIELKNRYQVKDDDKISIDESSRDDYRLRIENKYLRKFMKRFDRGANRERIDNLSREFKEELLDKSIVNWNRISYRYCGNLCVFLMNHYSGNETVNAGTGKELTIRELTELVAKVVGYTGKIEWDTSRPNGTPRKLLDVSKAAKLGWTYKTELEDGLRLSYEDFLNNPMRAER